VSGQDGSYLAELMLLRGHEVYGTTRDPSLHLGPNLAHLDGKIRMIYTHYDLTSIMDILREVRPDEIYNFAGQTYVSKSWEMIGDTVSASAMLPCTILEAIVRVDKGIRFFQASSCEIYSMDWKVTINERTPIAPSNPYGCSKALAHNMVASYRHNYGLYAVSGILFHHESPRRHENFVSRKVIKAAVAIKLGRQKELVLGNVEVARDWAFAPDVVSAAEKMMQLEQPQDFVICSGETRQLRELVEESFALLDLDYRQYLRVDPALFRATEAPIIAGSNEKAREVLEWSPKTSFSGMMKKMVDYELRLRSGAEADFGSEKPFQ
jgi:GDPmannose 4,6-dehydratase